MRLICCHIENFGKLHDATIQFQPGCQIICGENGWGKSTLAAFIRVMFFGFEGESRRKNIENERKRYAPWQGGGYGGSLTFETGGSAYIVTRIFGDKKINDSFDLRDEKTNLPSGDFTENLGEEIFLINSESFMRTVFIGQNDCATGATDSINARISNITDNMNDLDCYEKASGALQETLNKLNPRRKTGEIYRVNDRVTRLQTEVTQGASLEDSIRRYEDLYARERQHLQEIKGQQEAVFEQQRRASRAQDARAKQAAYEQICGNYEEKQAAYQRAKAFFPGEIPAEEELRMYMSVCDGMERSAEGMRLCSLSEEEKGQLQMLADELESFRVSQAEAGQDQSPGIGFGAREKEQTRVPGNTDIGENNHEDGRKPGQGDRDEREMRVDVIENRSDAQTGSQASGRGGIFGWAVAGAMFLIAGLIFLFLSGRSGRGFVIPAVILAAAGVLFLIVGLMTGQRNAREEQHRREEQLRREEAERRGREEAEQARLMEEDRRRWEAERLAAERAQKQKQYDSLEKKNQDFRRYRVQHDENQAVLANAFLKMGFPVTDVPRDQLQMIWKQRIRWQQAKRDLDAAMLKKQEFESRQDMPAPGSLQSQQESTISGAGEMSGEEGTDVRKQKALSGKQTAETPASDRFSIHTLEDLNRQQRQLEQQSDEIKDQLEIYRTQLTSLRENYDDWVQEKELLRQEKDKLKMLRRQYRQVQRAQEYLTTAKETLTARYMEPLMDSFSRYYRTVAGTSGTAVDRYHMDANTQITVEEEGMQRETAYLSRGYQDLIGLCLRLALVDAMYQAERPFLILDDPFVNLDEEKTAGGKRLLEEISREYQVIWFTAK